jgi:CDP-6-deoxy-D-xylo-4-hexulose-3-dehydrase
MQAAIGCAQLKKLPQLIKIRQDNWQYLKQNLQDCADKLILPEPTENSANSWFGFLIYVKENVGFSRDEMVQHLEKHNIQTRMLFAGNLIKHPCFDEMRTAGKGYRQIGDLANTNRIMNDVFWIGVYPGMTTEMLDYMILKIKEYAESK